MIEEIILCCLFCGEESQPNPPGWLVMHNKVHCEKPACIALCEECKDDFVAIGAEDKSKKEVSESYDIRGLKVIQLEGKPNPFYEVSLNAEELNEANHFGLSVHNARKESPYQRAWHGPEGLIHNNVMSAKTEVVMRKVFGVSPMIPKVFDKGGDDGKNDVPLASGKSISIKSVRKFYHGKTYFLYQIPAILKDDYGVLIVPAIGEDHLGANDIKRFWILGYISREEFEKRKHPIEGKFGPMEGVYHYEMDDFGILYRKEGPNYVTNKAE